MDREAFVTLSNQERVDHVNKRLAEGEAYEDILASIGFTKKEAGQSAPYGLGFIKIGNEVTLKPGKGDNGFAW